MGKVSLNLLAVLLLTTMILACGNNSDNSNNNHDVEVEDDTNNIEVVEDEVVDKIIDFSKFEHYATILTKADLMAQFGNSDLSDNVEYYAEGTVEKHSTTLTNTQNGYILKYIWEDDNSTTAWIEASYNQYNEDYDVIGTQTVVTESGLSTGMSLLELREWNGADFKFSGFGWDYGGGIYSEEGSRISASPIRITLGMLSYEGFDFAVGDIELTADDSRLENANIIVSQLTLYIDQ